MSLRTILLSIFISTSALNFYNTYAADCCERMTECCHIYGELRNYPATSIGIGLTASLCGLIGFCLSAGSIDLKDATGVEQGAFWLSGVSAIPMALTGVFFAGSCLFSCLCCCDN